MAIVDNVLPTPRTKAEFDERCLCLCALYRLSETSGVRTLNRNDEVKGHPNSKHLLAWGGMSKDLVADDPSDIGYKAIFTAAKTLGLYALIEYALDGTPSHLHVQGHPTGGTPA